MEAIALSLGAIPYLSGRTLLALGVLFCWYTLRGIIETREFSPSSVLIGITLGALAVILHFTAAWVRGVLAAMEQEFNAWIRRLDMLFTTVLAMCFALALLGGFGGRLVGFATGMPFAAVGGVTLSPEVGKRVLILLGVGVTAYAFARIRAWVGNLFNLLPLSDEPGVQRVLFLAESVLTVAGMLIALTFPVVGVVIMVLLFATLIAVGLMLRAVARSARGKCGTCAADLHLAASACHACAAPCVPRRIGFLGRVLEGAPTDLQKHQHALLAARRCPCCAERLETVGGEVRCSACRAPAFQDDESCRSFLRHVERRLAVLMPVLAALGLVPVLGIGAALVLYRLAPAGALGAFVTWKDRLGTRVLRVAAVLVLMLLQPLPMVGAFAVSGVIMLLHLSTRRAFLASQRATNHTSNQKADIARPCW
ncbi:MAG TPA: hypothetical protein VF815_34725 [Myxococcaceae bacterium]|jgi:hypothetical protein